MKRNHGGTRNLSSMVRGLARLATLCTPSQAGFWDTVKSMVGQKSSQSKTSSPSATTRYFEEKHRAMEVL